MPLILRILTALILFYRRWLSGRGPLRDVRCSFAPHESCSAFGLRATSEAPGARAALGRIVRRIRRCRDACLISDGHALSWSPLHDLSPHEILDVLRADGEGAPAIERMLRVRRAVAVWRADAVAIHACDELLAQSACDELRRAPTVNASRGEADTARMVAEPAIRLRARRRLVVLFAIALGAALVLGILPWFGSLMLGLAATAGTLSARTTLERERRFDMHRTWAARRRSSLLTSSALVPASSE